MSGLERVFSAHIHEEVSSRRLEVVSRRESLSLGSNGEESVDRGAVAGFRRGTECVQDTGGKLWRSADLPQPVQIGIGRQQTGNQAWGCGSGS